MFKILKSTLLLHLLLVSSISYPQSSAIDSIKTVLRNPKLHDTTKLSRIGLTMDSGYTENDPKYYYLNNLIGAIAIRNLKKTNNPILHETYTMWLGTYYNVLAIDYGHKKDVVRGLAALNKSIAVYKSIKAYDDVNYQIIMKGSFYEMFNENDKAIACVFTALKYFEKDKKKYSGEIAYAMSILGNIYNTLGNYKKSIEYNKKSIEYNSSNDIHVDYQKDFLKSVAYGNIAECYLALKNYPEAIAYSKKGLLLCKKTGDKVNESIILCKLGIAKMFQYQYDEAEAILKEALSLSADNRAIAQANLSLGELYYRRKESDKIEFYANQGLIKAKECKDLILQEQAYSLLYCAKIEKKDFKKALRLFEIQQELKYSIKVKSSKDFIAQQLQKYDFEKRELNYKLANQKENAAKNNWLLLLSSTLLLILFGGYFYYKNNKQKQAISFLEKNHIRQKLLISQMNPHFIFNSVQNIRSLIKDKQDTAAINYLDRFSKLTRQILENSEENYISMAEEIGMIENYLSIQQLLYDNKFEFNVTVDPSIDTESVFLPPMLTQPFIENAIKHGADAANAHNNIGIRFYLMEDKLFFEVSDNGKGFGSNVKNDAHKSMAMKITGERLNHYTKNRKFSIQTDNITDKEGNIKGAKVHFEIPYLYEN